MGIMIISKDVFFDVDNLIQPSSFRMYVETVSFIHGKYRAFMHKNKGIAVLNSLERESYTVCLRGEGDYNILPTPRGSSRSPNSAAVSDVLKTFEQGYRIMKV